MVIYWILFIYLIILALLGHSNIINKNKIIFMASLGIFLIMALRNENVGTDLSAYIDKYTYSFQVIKNYEYGYLLLSNILHFFGFSKQMFVAFIAAVSVCSAAIFIRRYSKLPILSFIAYVSMGLFAFSMSGLRQALAICVIMFAIKYIIDKKWIRFIAFVLVASLFHYSALICLPAVLLIFLKKSRKSYIFIMIILVLLLIYNREIFQNIINLLPSDYTAYNQRYFSSSINPLAVVEGISIVIISAILINMHKKSGDEIGESTLVLFKLSCINTALLILSLNNAMGDRFAIYYSIANIVLIPNVLCEIKDQMIRKWVIAIVIIVFIIRFAITIPGGSLGIDQYEFFWRNY